MLTDAFARVSDSKLVAFGTGNKYSILNKYNGKVYYITNINNNGFNELNNLIKETKKQGAPVYLIIKKKKKYPSEIMDKFKKLEDGVKYDLYIK